MSNLHLFLLAVEELTIRVSHVKFGIEAAVAYLLLLIVITMRLWHALRERQGLVRCLGAIARGFNVRLGA